MKKIVLASALAVMTGSAWSQEYVGGAYGATQVDINCEASAACDKNDHGYKVYGGYQFTPVMAAELGYIEFGKLRNRTDSELGATSVTLAAAFRGHFNPVLIGVARLGLARVETRVTSRFGRQTETGVKAYAGLGLEYAFSKQVRGTMSADLARGEYSSDDIVGLDDEARVHGAGVNLRAFTLGVLYGF